MKTVRDGSTSLYMVFFFIAAALACQASPPAGQEVSDRPDRIILSLTEVPGTRMAVAWRTRTCHSPPAGQITVATGFTNLDKNARTVEGTTEEVSLGPSAGSTRGRSPGAPARVAWRAIPPRCGSWSVALASGSTCRSPSSCGPSVSPQRRPRSSSPRASTPTAPRA